MPWVGLLERVDPLGPIAHEHNLAGGGRPRRTCARDPEPLPEGGRGVEGISSPGVGDHAAENGSGPHLA